MEAVVNATPPTMPVTPAGGPPAFSIPLSLTTAGGARVQPMVAGADVASGNPLPVTTAPPTATSGVVPVVSAVLENSHVLKAGAGVFLGGHITTTTVGGYLMLFDSTTAPGDGAVTPIGCWVVSANSTAVVGANPGISVLTGAVVVFSTTGPFTKTASATAYFSMQVV